MRFAVSTLAVILMTAAILTPSNSRAQRGLEVGQRLEPRGLKTLDLEEIRAPHGEGLTILVFWATWSPRSVPALELWQRFATEYGEHALRVITVNADHQHMEEADIRRVREYIDEHELNLPVILDSELQLFNEIGIIILPTAIYLMSDGTINHKYPGFPRSAELDLREDLEIRLGLASEPSEEEMAGRGKLAYQPENNALLYYNMGKRFQEKGFVSKAEAKYVEALQKDPEYGDPLRGLESIYFRDGRTPESEDHLRALLAGNGLHQLVDRIGQGEQSDELETENIPIHEEDGSLSPMEKMRLLMEKGGEQ